VAFGKNSIFSQDDFAQEFGFTINQIRDWEQGRTLKWTPELGPGIGEVKV
jgi:DNA-binding transcriptional regulator YiaG